MKKQLIVASLVVFCLLSLAAIYQNYYTSHTTAAVDAHVQALFTAASGVTNNASYPFTNSVLTIPVAGVIQAEVGNIDFSDNGGAGIVTASQSAGDHLGTFFGANFIDLTGTLPAATNIQTRNGSGAGLSNVSALYASLATNVVGGISITNPNFYSDSTHFAYFHNAALTSTNTADGTTYQVSHKYLIIATSNFVNEVELQNDGSNAVLSVTDLSVGTNILTMTPTNFNFGGDPIIGYGASLTNPAAMSANTNGLASLTQAAQIANAVAGAIVGNGANALTLSLTGAAAAGQSNAWVSLGSVTNNYQANFMAQAYTNVYFSGCSNLMPGFNFTIWITQGSATTTNLVTFNTNYWQPQIFGQVLTMPTVSTTSGELISCFAIATNIVKFTQTIFP